MVKDYWTFEPILQSFKDVGYGRIETIDGLDWRVRGGDYVLLTPPKKVFNIPQGANRLRSLTWSNSIGDEVPKKSVGYNFAALPDWSPNTRYLQRVIRKGTREGLVIREPDRSSLESLLDEWVINKREHKPTTMIVRGHYASMILEPRISFRGYYLGDRLVGALGFTYHSVSRNYAICFAKHAYGFWWLAHCIWAQTLIHLFSQKAKAVVCGDTANRLKQKLGLVPEKQYKVDFSKF